MHYTGTIWRPPYEADSLLLEVTAGCTHHRCKFCTLYNDLPFPFRMSPLEDIESDLRELAGYGGLHFTRAFLTGANPFILQTDRLLEIARLVRQYQPAVQTIGCFARITDITRKTQPELEQLQKAGYDGLTIGVETGDGQALCFMDKGYGPEDIRAQCRRLEAAGIGYSFFYLTGISGAGRGEEGAKQSAALFNQLHPARIGANMLTIYPDSALFREIQRGNWQEEGELEKYRELRVLAEGLTIPTEFAALGASNAFQLRGRLPEDRARLLGQLDAIIGQADEGALRRYRTTLPHL